MILHIVAESSWVHAKSIGEYRHPSLDREGFIHFSKPDQVVRVANFNFKGQTGLVLLIVDDQKLRAQIKYEGENPKDLFPHLYGTLNIDAVVGTVSFPPNSDGTFSLPELI